MTTLGGCNDHGIVARILYENVISAFRKRDIATFSLEGKIAEQGVWPVTAFDVVGTLCARTRHVDIHIAQCCGYYLRGLNLSINSALSFANTSTALSLVPPSADRSTTLLWHPLRWSKQTASPVKRLFY